METGPSPLIVRLVEILLPPSCREEVIGDLFERALSPRAFLLDALGTVPFVVWSRIRRTSNPGQILGAATAMLIIYRIAARDRAGWLVAAIPAGLATIVLVLRDAYVADQTRSRIAAAADAFLAMAAALALGSLTAIIQPTAAMPQSALLIGSLYSLVLLLIFRMQTVSDGGRIALSGGATANPDALRQRSDRLWNLFWLAGVVYLLALCSVMAGPVISPKALAPALAFGVAMRRYGAPPAPASPRATLRLSHRLDSLARRRDQMRHWPSYASVGLAAVCGFPMFGYLLIRVTDLLLRLDTPPFFDPVRAWPAWAPVVAISAAWLLVGTLLSRRTACAIQDEINALDFVHRDDHDR